ncbi:MAG: alpha/beta fold hydrolase [Woeseia sp.]|nr:alpha/beta fold hydrolase [Woeseia sp.]NNE60565.1 alpha/beta fold hydrolase [Woeseia sp.]
MKILRTPDQRFTDLPGFSFAPRYLEDLLEAQGCRIHYVDEGPAEAETVWLCLHGEPTWSYLYRKMIPVFVQAGHRVIAPDFIGFGRSDKFVEDAAYTFELHRNMLLAFIERLDLQNIHLVCQDWGGLLGLTLPMALPQRFAGLLVMNTAFATGEQPLGEGFTAWRDFARSHPDLDVAALMKRSTPILSDAEAAAYAAPFPDVTYKAGVRRFPDMVADKPDAPGAKISRQARDWFKSEWRGKSFMAIGMQDPVLGPAAMKYLHGLIPGCPAPLEVHDAGHFVQEWGKPIAERALAKLR